MAFTAKQRKWRAVAQKNPAGFVNTKLRIPDLLGRDVPMRYKYAQRKVSDKIKEIKASGMPVRLWVLKWRRAGITSSRSAEGYAHVYGNDNARIGVIAHQEDRAKEILANYKAFDESLARFNPDLVLEKSKDNIFGLKFAGSNAQVLIGTANNPIKIRGDGIHILDGSEAAHWYNQFDAVMKEVAPVVPPLPGTQIVLESTGSLMGSQPYQHYMESKHGKTEFITMFLCWLEDPSMVVPFTSDQQRDEVYQKIHQLEPRLAEKNAFYKLTPEQIHMSWIMYFYQSKCDFDYFCREFPYTEEEAWSAGGSSYFGVYEIGKAQPRQPEMIFVFDQHNINRVFTDPGELRRVDAIDDYSVLPHLKLWAPPKKGNRYVIGTDGSSGDYGGDYSAGHLIDMHTREHMASYHGLLRPDEAAHITVSLCRMYNNALAAPETNPAGGGMEALNCIQRLGYHIIYQWRVRDGARGLETNGKLGWWTHQRSRPLMLGELRKIFIDGVTGRIPDPGMFRDKALINEMRTFGTNATTGIPEANNNCFDDRVMAAAIAHQVANDEVYCTSNDLLFKYHRAGPAKPAVDQEKLIRTNPDQVIARIMGKNSNFMRNKFEI